MRELEATQGGRKEKDEVKRKMIKESSFSVSKACSTLGIKRSSYYWANNLHTAKADTHIRNTIHDISLEFMGYGYRRITAELHRRNQIVNRKKVLRIMREEKLLCVKKKFKPSTTNSSHNYPLYPNLTKGVEVMRLNQIWVSDITYIFIGDGHVYLAAIIDRYSRKCVGWDLSRNIDTQLVLTALNIAVSERKSIGFDGLIHHSDRGVQYASKDYVNRLNELGIKVSMTETGNPRENAFAESFMKTLKYEEVNLKEYETFDEAYKNIKQFIEDVYNAKRLHSSIGYAPPDEFEKEVLNIR